jgi:pectinesterase
MAPWTTKLLPLLLVHLLVVRGGDGAAVFSGYTFKGQGEAEAFEDALLRQACFNVSSSGAGRGHCVSRLDTARGGAGSGPVPVLRAALRDTLSEAVGAVGSVARLASLSNHEREEMAVDDCIELLGYSVDELGWSLDAMAAPVDARSWRGREHGTASGGVRKGARAKGDPARLAQRRTGQPGHLHGGLPRDERPPAAPRQGVRGAADRCSW